MLMLGPLVRRSTEDADGRMVIQMSTRRIVFPHPGRRTVKYRILGQSVSLCEGKDFRSITVIITSMCNVR